MPTIRWGIIGCGDVTERKSGPGFQKANGSTLVAVMRRDRALAEDYARRHGVPRVHATAAGLITDPDIDAVYIATPPSSHCELALAVAAAGKPCLVEKPMARSHAECLRMVEAFRTHRAPLWVAYYRRALPRFLRVRNLLEDGRIGTLSSAHIETIMPSTGMDQFANWRIDPDVNGAGLFFDVGSHAVDLVDFLIGPITGVTGVARNTTGAVRVEDVTAAVFDVDGRVPATGIWNFNAGRQEDRLTIIGSSGSITTSILGDGDVVLESTSGREVFPIRNPEHVHQPLIQSIVNELLGRGTCPSTAASGARASWVLGECVKEFYGA
jgi:predicted dehydrogenase